jgi:EAL domain-containing protein (putative c-di-GMP-specific phosphodiesterase class I)
MFVNCYINNIEYLCETWKKSGSGQNLVIELDLNFQLFDVNQLTETVQRAQAMGIAFALDDIGKTPIDWDLCRAIRPDFVKLDIALIRNIVGNKAAHERFLRVYERTRKYVNHIIIEGVETAEQLELLKELPGALFQGFFFGVPKQEFIQISNAWV